MNAFEESPASNRSHQWLRLMLCIAAFTLAAAFLPPAQAAAQPIPDRPPHQLLAERYAPVAVLKEQPVPCSVSGEPYMPLPVELVFDSFDVTLRQEDPQASTDPIIMYGPGVADLADLDSSYYLDFPGNPLRPGCDYERWSRIRAEVQELEPSVYARIATEEGVEGLALQYWFFYIFNDFNNRHEGDWEMIQLTWDVSSVDEALTMPPVSVAYAQHSGAERAEWNEDKLEREGTHAIVYVSSGSHAAYYSRSIWIGWTPNTGVGCDDTDPPSERVPLRVIGIPEVIEADSPFAWLLFEGRWGEHVRWEFSGPRGPNIGGKWTTPVTWVDHIRDESVAVPHRDTVGPGPMRMFCSVTSLAGRMMAEVPEVRREIAALVIALSLVPLMFAMLAWRYVARALVLYVRHLPLFLTIGLIVYPIAIAGAAAERAINRTTLGSTLLRWSGEASLPQFVLGIGLGGLQQLLLGVLVAPAIIHVTYDLYRQDPTSLRQSWRTALHRLPTTTAAMLLAVVVLLLMSATVVLLPLVVFFAVRWLYTPHAVIIDGAAALDARQTSASVVKGHWGQTLGMALLIGFITGVPGPVIAVALIVFGGVSMQTGETLSSLIFAATFPLAIIASTLYYLNIRGKLPEPIPLDAAPHLPRPALDALSHRSSRAHRT